MRNQETELVIRLGWDLTGSSPEVLREFVIVPCPDNANAAHTLEIQLERRPLGSSIILTMPTPPWGDV
jgi:hypothetical protein